MANGDGSIKMQDNDMPIPKIKHDWYQTETHIIITILAKNIENLKIFYEKTTLSVSAKLPSGNDYSLELDLAHPIVPDQCSHKILASKIEIKLKKQDGIRWATLEGNPVDKNLVEPIPQEILQSGNQPPKYPSSCKKSRDWNKIYGSGSDEVRRAMNKSFLESGGTVLSTNWSVVGKGKVERKPPDGMEWRSWNS
ncbi:hypothetical protein HZH66_013433 [Vespula vulgaris]|uniref:Uncharacterized protein n=1 Tax=Vespula vulgaris TaxID=7454 RepID=A0A834J6I1_VESVU|nr:hypothetical protein HZH66_013433 [Vespula vulgaris]